LHQFVSNRAPLVRMMFLVAFLIIVLIMYSTQLSRNLAINIDDPIFRENIIVKDDHRAFFIRLHSITVQANNISGYSNKYDSLMILQITDEDLKILKSKLDKLPRNINKCNICHKEDKTHSGLFDKKILTPSVKVIY